MNKNKTFGVIGVCGANGNLIARILKQRGYNVIGTDLTLELSEHAVWNSAASECKDGMFVNMPSYEIFTSPDYRKTEGIVYGTRPLVYNGGIIDDFFIFKLF